MESRVPRILQAYMSLLRRRPFLTNMATSSTLMLVGDVVAQQIELASARRKNETPGHFLQHRQVLLQPSWLFPAGIELQLTRTSVMCTWAGLMGLFWTAWFRRMDLIFHKLPKLVGVIGKVAATAITPPFTNTAFMGIVTMIEETVINGRGDDPEYLLRAARAKVDKDLWHTIKASWSFWTPTNFVAWMFLAPPLRVPFGSAMSMLWNVYLSLIQHR